MPRKKLPSLVGMFNSGRSDLSVRAKDIARGREPLTVWAVIYSNYEPTEVDSFWRTEQGASERAAELGDGWGVSEWGVRD